MTSSDYFVHPTAILGAPVRYLQGCKPWDIGAIPDQLDLKMPKKVFVGPYACIGVGAEIGEAVVIDAYCRVEPLARVGANSMVLYRGTIGVDASVGQWCVVGGSVSENTIIEDHVTSFGKLIHTHWDSASSWDFRPDAEPSPIIRSNSFVGHDARVIGGIEVGPNSYVCSGATVTRAVPPFHIASGVNKIIHYSKWVGNLRNNPIFESS